MNNKEFAQSLNTLNRKLYDDAKTDYDLKGLENRYKDSYIDLIKDGCDSKNNRQIITYLVHLLIDRIFTQHAFGHLSQALKNEIMPFLESEIKHKDTLKNINSILKIAVEKNKKDRRKGAEAMLANSPVEAAKKNIEEEYKIVRNQFKRRGFSAQFIRDMKEKYPIIIDIRTIERLVTKLNKVNEQIPPRLAKRVLK